MKAVAEVSSWVNLQRTADKWIHEPDWEALRICLATAKSLDLDTTPVWTMLIGAAGTGKTAFYVQSCLAYPRSEITDQTTVAGIKSASRDRWGKGILDRLTEGGKRGLWVFPDFTVILNSGEDKRNEIFGVQRRIFDGSFSRDADGEVVSWKGRVHSIAAVTPAIERYYHVHADLGQRYLQVRIDKVSVSDELVVKTTMQRTRWAEFQREVMEAAKGFLKPDSEVPTLPIDISRSTLEWADFVSQCRIPVTRNHKDEITGVAAEEGASRVAQQMQGVVIADAWCFGQAKVGKPQLPLIERLAFDCLPRDRRAILIQFRTTETVPAPEVQEISGITHPYAFSRAVDELEAIGAIIREGSGTLGVSKLKLAPRIAKLTAY